MTPYDVIVLGLGAMGSAAAFHAAQRERRVRGDRAELDAGVLQNLVEALDLPGALGSNRPALA